MATLSYSGASFTFPNLTAHPLGFDGDAQRGRTAETLTFTGLLRGAEPSTFLGIYRAWRDAKLPEEAPERTGVVGATVAVTTTGPGFAWSSRAAWFREPPAIEQVGAYVRVTASLVDAAQALAVLLREAEESLETEAGLGLGTLTFGGAVVNLTARPDSFEGLPQAELNPAGAHVITGSLAVVETREVEGWVTAANLTTLESWVKTTVAATPAAGTWFPVSWSQPVARARPNGGALAVAYDVSFRVVKIRG
jgi:hypothetical protein